MWRLILLSSTLWYGIHITVLSIILSFRQLCYFVFSQRPRGPISAGLGTIAVKPEHLLAFSASIIYIDRRLYSINNSTTFTRQMNRCQRCTDGLCFVVRPIKKAAPRCHVKLTNVKKDRLRFCRRSWWYAWSQTPRNRSVRCLIFHFASQPLEIAWPIRYVHIISCKATKFILWCRFGTVR